MKPLLSPRVHAILDHATTGLWFVGPEVFRMNWEPGSTLPPKLWGLTAVVNSSVTDWGPREGLEYGLVRGWSVKTHLALDIAGTTVVALAPWATGSWRRGWNYWVPQLGAWAIEVTLCLLTQIPEEQKKNKKKK